MISMRIQSDDDDVNLVSTRRTANEPLLKIEKNAGGNVPTGTNSKC
jgi:hypothetical protein